MRTRLGRGISYKRMHLLQQEDEEDPKDDDSEEAWWIPYGKGIRKKSLSFLLSVFHQGEAGTKSLKHSNGR